MEATVAAQVDVPPEPPRAIGSGDPLDREALLAVPLRSLPSPGILRAEITELRGAGPKLAAAAAELGIESLGDLLLHAPRDYRDSGGLTALADLGIGTEATVLAEVRSARARPTRRRGLALVEARIADNSGEAKAVWFGRRWLADQLKPGTRILIRGKMDRRGLRVADHEVLSGSGATAERPDPPRGVAGVGSDPPSGLHTTGLVPIHPASERLRSDRIREWAWQVVGVARHGIEPLPARLRRHLGLAGVADCLSAVHFPAGVPEAGEARHRLAFEELFLYQASLALRRRSHDVESRAPALEPAGALVERWLASLPFEPTGDQRRAFDEIDADLRAERPMQRLLMGEVGSGKTVVALYAMLRALEAGFQSALMAPTEVLAEQHFATLERLLAAEGLPAALLTGSTPAARRRDLLGHLASGQLGLVVGTHALIEETVEFRNLALAVVDEQHRFGVRQRAALDAKGPGELVPHVLHMTATPIPRTLSLTAYGDLDATVLRELPAGRRPVSTWVAGEDKREGAYAFIRERIAEGRQCFVVCPLVSESEKVQATAATSEAERLAAGPLAGLRVGVMHGQMPAAAKQSAMARFAGGETEVLVATSVIEVGIDVANATVIVIEEADRYGLSQLHQLRGRVGRGEHPSHCILFAEPKTELAQRRLDAIASEGDGFKLAEVDLALRGEGEILGTRQHGLPRFRVARLPEDTALLVSARTRALDLLREYSSLEHPALDPLIDVVRERFGDERIAA